MGENMNEEILVGDIYTLTDDESGEQMQYEIIGTAELNDVFYVALYPTDEEVEEYIILRTEIEEETGERILVTIEDDDEWESVAEYFDNEIFSDVDYDEEN